MTIHLQMSKKAHEKICDEVIAISPVIRFVGVIGNAGNLIAYQRRQGLVPLLNAKNTQYQFSHIAMKTDLEGFFDKSLGKIEFVWEERKKIQTISFAIKESRVWISVDKKVIRTEILRIIDSCLPIVKKYSK